MKNRRPYRRSKLYNFISPRRMGKFFDNEINSEVTSVLHEMTQRHNKVFFTMFTLKHPLITEDNNNARNILLAKFVEFITIYCHRQKWDPMHFWGRKNPEAGNNEFQFMLLLDGYLVQDAYYIIEIFNKLWAGILGIKDNQDLVVSCNFEEKFNCSYKIMRNGGILLDRRNKDFSSNYSYCQILIVDMIKRSDNDSVMTYEYGCSKIQTRVFPPYTASQMGVI